ncbi:MAG: hypothetical protein P8099_02590 [Gemmatimonadota bacterium]
MTVVPGTVTPMVAKDSTTADSLQRVAPPADAPVNQPADSLQSVQPEVYAAANQPADSTANQEADPAAKPDHRPPWAQRPHDGGRTALPPGLAKRDSASMPPGQAKKDEQKKEPPGQMKKDETQKEPPGQVNKNEHQNAGANGKAGEHGKPDQAGQQKAGGNDKAGQQGKPDQAGQQKAGGNDKAGQQGKPDQAGQQKAGGNDKGGQQGKPDQAGQQKAGGNDKAGSDNGNEPGQPSTPEPAAFTAPVATIAQLLASDALVGQQVQVTGVCLAKKDQSATGPAPEGKDDWQLGADGVAIWVVGARPAGCGTDPVTVVATVAQDQLPGHGKKAGAMRRYLWIE